MIATRQEIQALLAQDTYKQNDLIDRLIPILEDDIRNICNNAFLDSNVYVLSGNISFTHNSTSADVINIDDGFSDAQFKAGQTVRVQGSYNNDGFFDIESVSSTALTLYSESDRPYFDELVTEDEEVNVLITKVNYPKALKNVVAQMCNYKLTNHDYSVKSETVARYSVDYSVAGDSGYPKTITNSLKKFTKAVYV